MKITLTVILLIILAPVLSPPPLSPLFLFDFDIELVGKYVGFAVMVISALTVAVGVIYGIIRSGKQVNYKSEVEAFEKKCTRLDAEVKRLENLVVKLRKARVKDRKLIYRLAGRKENVDIEADIDEMEDEIELENDL